MVCHCAEDTHWDQRQSLIKYSTHTHNIYHICSDQNIHCMLDSCVVSQGCFLVFCGGFRAVLGANFLIIISLILEVLKRNI